MLHMEIAKGAEKRHRGLQRRRQSTSPIVELAIVAYCVMRGVVGRRERQISGDGIECNGPNQRQLIRYVGVGGTAKQHIGGNGRNVCLVSFSCSANNTV